MSLDPKNELNTNPESIAENGVTNLDDTNKINTSINDTIDNSTDEESDEEGAEEEEEDDDDEEDGQPPLFKLSKISIPEKKYLHQLIHPKDKICFIADHIINDSLIVLGTELGYIYIINIQNITVMKRLKLHRDYIMCIDINDKGWFMSCCIEGNVSIINYTSFLNHINKNDMIKEEEIDVDLLEIKRVNFNKSLNYVKIHPNFNNQNNKCFFISSFNGSLLAVNLDTFNNTKEVESPKVIEKTVDIATNWLSYIPTFSSNNNTNNNSEDIQKKLAFDVKITNLIDLDSITFLEIIKNDKLFFLDFNSLYIFDLNSGNHEKILLKLNIEAYQPAPGEETTINTVIYKNNFFININKWLLIVDIESSVLLKEIPLNEKIPEKIVSMKLFNTIPLEWEKCIDKKYNEGLPPLSIISKSKQSKKLNLHIIDINLDYDFSIHETIELPIGKSNVPLKIIFSNFNKNPKITIIFDSLIIKINPFQRNDIFKWFLENEQLYNAWKICEDNKKKLNIGVDLVKQEIGFLEEIFKIQNYNTSSNNSITMDSLIAKYDEIIVDYYCYNFVQGYKALTNKLITLKDDSYNSTIFFNNNSLTKILNKIVDAKDFKLLQKTLVTWEMQISFSKFDYSQIIEKLSKAAAGKSTNDIDLLNCLTTCYYRTNQFDECIKILYQLIELCGDSEKTSDVYKHKILHIIQLSPKLLINIVSEEGQFNEFLAKISNYSLKNIREFKLHFKSIIKLLINNISVENVIKLSSMIDSEKFPEFQFLLLLKVYSFVPAKHIKAVTLSIIKLYLANDIFIECNPNLIQFLISNSNNYDSKEILNLILQNNGKLAHNEELIYLYSQLNDYTSALKLILKTGLTNPINYIMTTETTINDHDLWREIMKYSNENGNLLTKEIIRTINKNENINMNTVIFLYEELLNSIDCEESLFQNGIATTTKNLQVKKLEFAKLKNLLTSEVKHVFAERMRCLQTGKYYE
ncbi:hypothetical protein ACO0SA_004082 [Hanseniaspora valbyensis]